MVPGWAFRSYLIVEVAAFPLFLFCLSILKHIRNAASVIFYFSVFSTLLYSTAEILQICEPLASHMSWSRMVTKRCHNAAF